MKQSIVIALLCTGCDQFGSKSNIVPSVGTYTMTPVEAENSCGPNKDIEDFDSIPSMQVEVDVHVGARQLSITFDYEHERMYVLYLKDNVATYEEMIKQRWSEDQTYVVTEDHVMNFTWNSPTSSYGSYGWNIRCDGDCPANVSDFGAENLPCTTNLFYSLEMIEEQ